MHRTPLIVMLAAACALGLGSGVAAAAEGSPEAELSAVADDMIQNAPVVKIIQEKSFIKARRMEFSIFAGGVTNDPFLRRWVGGGALTYHVNELVSLEGAYSYSPDLGTGDNRQLTAELENQYAVTPVISKLQQSGSVDLVFSPLYGKVAFLRQSIVSFDLYLAAGGGVTRTIDQSDFLCDGTRRDDAVENPNAQDTLSGLELDALCELHFTTNYGFGMRGAFNDFMAVRIDGRSYTYVEHEVTQDSESEAPYERLAMKNNFVAQIGLSFFFPRNGRPSGGGS